MSNTIHNLVKKRSLEGNIRFSRHSLKRINLRNFTEDKIKEYLSKEPEYAEKQEDKISEKYKLHYRYAEDSEKDLIIVICDRANGLNIITAYIQDRRRRK